MIQVFSNSLGTDELLAVERVFRSRWIGSASQVLALETELARYWNVDNSHVLLTNCCTSAIYIALRALGICPGDEVIIPSIGFVAFANAVIEIGAIPVFVDVNPQTLAIDVNDVACNITKHTKALFVLHYGGHSCDVSDLKTLCGMFGTYIIEDAANAVSSTVGDNACGTLGDIGVWSFDSMKILAMGDGGALYAKNEEVVERARILRHFGFDPARSAGHTSSESRWWEYDVIEPSGRFVSNDILASIGRVQLQRLPRFIQQRKDIWTHYQYELAGLPITLPPEPVGGKSSYYLYWIQTNCRDELAMYLRQHDVYTTFRYFPLHLVEGFSKWDVRPLPNAEYANACTLCLPIHQNMLPSDVHYVVDTVRQFYANR